MTPTERLLQFRRENAQHAYRPLKEPERALANAFADLITPAIQAGMSMSDVRVAIRAAEDRVIYDNQLT